jgi:hypothetical protein
MTQEKKTSTEPNQALMVMIQPDGLAVDFQPIEEPLDSAQERFQDSWFAAFQENPDQAFYKLAFTDRSLLRTPSMQYAATISRSFVRQIAERPEREFLRESLDITLQPDQVKALLDQAPYMNGMEHLDARWINQAGHRLKKIFASDIKDYSGTVAEYLSERHAPVVPSGRVYFHLVESKQTLQPFAFMATYVTGVDAHGKANHLPLAHALRVYQSNREKLLNVLSTVTRAAEESSWIQALMDSGEIFQPIGLTSDEAYIFLKEISLYEASGIVCRMPYWWKKRNHSAAVTVRIGDTPPARLGMNALIQFNIQIALGDLELSESELRQLLSETDGLVLIKGRWVEVDHERLKSVLHAYESAKKKMGSRGISLIDAMRMQWQSAGGSKDLIDDAEIEVTHGAWLSDFLKQMSSEMPTTTSSVGLNFLARLRPYQERGLAWLHQMKTLGLGACLADDMGLGKTVQVIALLNEIRSRKSERSLLVVPASLIGNWRREIERFAPDLRLAIIHPSEYSPEKDDNQTLPEQYDLLITTYGMVYRYEWLKTIE